MRIFGLAAAALAVFSASLTHAYAGQNTNGAEEPHELYISWGYNADSYRPVELRMSQPVLGNDFTLHDVDFHDSKGWNENLLKHKLTGPQYNFQIGYFIRKNTALELNFVHAKAVVTQNQTVRITGMLDGQPIDRNIVLTEDVLAYKLNNGANFVLFNVVRRVPIFGEPGQTGSIAALGKAGVGFVEPHTENSVFGVPNIKGFQFGGIDMGAELAVRLQLFRAIYGEFCEKGVYARYRGLHIDQGRADQDLWARVSSLSIGVSFKLGRKR